MSIAGGLLINNCFDAFVKTVLPGLPVKDEKKIKWGVVARNF